ncbi:hypothetical protein GQ44DRAFT_718545 [Phaeosphaeriaceae sp. PMI808]|nr:hypothetical protein GQ44DRAFT_718545 [Phaeosphaeriaceae sp. PMI808]
MAARAADTARTGLITVAQQNRSSTPLLCCLGWYIYYHALATIWDFRLLTWYSYFLLLYLFCASRYCGRDITDLVTITCTTWAYSCGAIEAILAIIACLRFLAKTSSKSCRGCVYHARINTHNAASVMGNSRDFLKRPVVAKLSFAGPVVRNGEPNVRKSRESLAALIAAI